jgi:hypothetical protein
MSDDFGGWMVLAPGQQDEVMERLVHLLATCEHEWGDWDWDPGTAISRGGFRKQCALCHIWMYDVIVNAGLNDRQ